MNEQPTFMDQLLTKRAELEQTFDSSQDGNGLAAYIRHLEALSDLVGMEQDNAKIPEGLRPQWLAVLVLTTQSLWGAMNLARIGLFSVARAVLRCALEHELRWEYVQSQPRLAAKSEKEPWKTKVDEMDPKDLKGLEKDLWLQEGLTVFSDMLTNDVHLNIGTLTCLEGLGPGGYSKIGSALGMTADCSHADLKRFGGWDDEEAKDLYLAWLRLCSRLFSRSAVGELIHKIQPDLYPKPAISTIRIDRAKLAGAMWARKQYKPVEREMMGRTVRSQARMVSFLDLKTGTITADSFSDGEDSTLLFWQLPICERDPIVHGYLANKRLPIPTCTRRLKRKIIEAFAGEVTGTEELSKRFGMDFNSFEKHVLRTYPDKWPQYRDGRLLEWLRHFGVQEEPS